MALRDVLILLMTFEVIQVFGRSLNNNTQPIGGITENEVNLNSVFDYNIETIKRMIYEKNLDPLEMPDRILEASDVLPIAILHLHSGQVQQLASITRTGDIVARYHGKNVTVELDLGWDDIYVDYAYTLKVLFHVRDGDFHGYFNKMRVAVKAIINLDNYYIELKYFRIIDTGDFKFELTGHISDYLINAITRIVTVFAKERIVREIECHFRNSIREKIDEINELTPDSMEQKNFIKLFE